MEECCGDKTSTDQNSPPKYKGVRKRKWGKWVSEIRLPNSRERIWLGSFDSPEKAARAFDAALYCLRGPGASFNFPENPPEIPGGRSLTPQEIQVVANRFANNEAGYPPRQRPRTTAEVGISARGEIEIVGAGTTSELVANNNISNRNSNSNSNYNSNSNGNNRREVEVDDEEMTLDWSEMLEGDHQVGPPTMEFGYFPSFLDNDEHNLFFATQHPHYSTSSFYDDDDFSHHSLNLWNFH